MKKVLITLLLLFAAFPLLPARAQEAGSPEDNACNPGGAMWRANPEDGCTTEWHWTCGYYLARFYTYSYNVGSYETALVPDWCGSLLPPRRESPSVFTAENVGNLIPSPVCYEGATDAIPDILYNGVPNSQTNFARYLSYDGTCSGALGTGNTVVFANSPAAALSICLTIGIGYPGTPDDFQIYGPYPSAPANLWVCTIS